MTAVADLLFNKEYIKLVHTLNVFNTFTYIQLTQSPTGLDFNIESPADSTWGFKHVGPPLLIDISLD